MKKFWGRFTVWDRTGVQSKRTPYQTRYWIGRLRLHIFHRADEDPDWHDHPWGFWTFPLTSYVEEVVSSVVPECVNAGMSEWIVHDDIGNAFHSSDLQYVRRRVVRAFRLHYRPAEFTHKIVGRFDGWNVDLEVDTDNDDFMRDIFCAPFEYLSEGHSPYVQPAVDPNRKIVTIVWREHKSRVWGFLKKRLHLWCWEDAASYHGPEPKAMCDDRNQG